MQYDCVGELNGSPVAELTGLPFDPFEARDSDFRTRASKTRSPVPQSTVDPDFTMANLIAKSFWYPKLCKPAETFLLKPSSLADLDEGGAQVRQNLNQLLRSLQRIGLHLSKHGHMVCPLLGGQKQNNPETSKEGIPNTPVTRVDGDYVMLLSFCPTV